MTTLIYLSNLLLISYLIFLYIRYMNDKHKQINSQIKKEQS